MISNTVVFNVDFLFGLLSFVIVILLIVVTQIENKINRLKNSNKELNDKNNELADMYSGLEELHKKLTDEHSRTVFLKKSSETRIGLVGEQLAPYLDDWPFDSPREFRLISSPIDGVNFGKDAITFVEIKTGKSKLSKGQKRIRDLVRDGKVNYVEFRVGEDGCEIKKI